MISIRKVRYANRSEEEATKSSFDRSLREPIRQKQKVKHEKGLKLSNQEVSCFLCLNFCFCLIGRRAARGDDQKLCVPASLR
jgi:hypothetical protein